MTQTLQEVAELYAEGIYSEEDVVWFLNKHNEPYKSFEELPKEFHDFVDMYEAVIYVRERDEAEILETLRNIDE